MEYMIAVFRARSQTMKFYALLKSYGVSCSVISTPRVINVSCGISVKFQPADKQLVDNILARRKFDTYAGSYLLRDDGKNTHLA